MKPKDQTRLSEVTAGLKKKKAAPAGQMELKETDHKEEAALTKGDVLPSKVDHKPMQPSGRFDYVKYDGVAVAKSAAFKEKFVELDKMLDEAFGAMPASIKVGRARQLAVQHLEEAFMWIGKAIRDEQVVSRSAELQEERNNA